jgi:glycosyltransferase involved in cell wall biosynthesis
MLLDVDVLVILSLWDETFCLTLTEAQALGMPVIATKVGAIQDRVVHGVTGYLVDHRDVGQMADLIRKIRVDGSLDQIKENLMKLKTYTIKENCMEYRRIYSEVSR